MKSLSKKVLLLGMVLILALVFCACSKKVDTSGPSEGTISDPAELITAEITMEDGGVITLELDSGAAPKTVENFVKLAKDGFYDGLTFHRIIPGFMIQGGDPQGTGLGGSKDAIRGEFSDNGFDNPISHEKGVISMARKGNDMDSATSQFFITNSDARSQLDGQYAAFGHVVSGIEVVDEISAVPTGENDKPINDVIIKSIKIID